MMGIDCTNQQTAQDCDCSHCIWHTSGQCANWDCEPVSRKEALEALEKVKAMESAQSTHSNTPNTLEALDCISRQQAVDVLDVLCQEHRYKIPGKRETYSQYNEAWQDALDRAEGAIFNLPTAQPEPSTEIQEILEYLDTTLHPIVSPDNWNVYSELHDMVSRLPSAQPEQRWIPVTERLPEENQICIVTDETRQNTYEYRFCKQTYDEEQGWTYLKHRIIAWMPLPEPY